MNKKQPTILLIVEDESTIRGLWKKLLEEQGYKVEEARDGRNGFKLFKRTKPDLLILDLCMEPRGMDEGKYFLRKKSKNKDLKEIPVIIISGAFPKEKLELYKNAFEGIREVLTKPVSDNVLVQTVNKYC